MFLDTRDFEGYLKVDKAIVTKGAFNEVHFSDQGVDLRIMSASQFSGIARLQLDPQGIPTVLPGSVTRMLSSDPFRFREREAFLLRTHLIIERSLPRGIIATITTDPILLSFGSFVVGSWREDYTGPLRIVLFSFRRMEIDYGYVVAKLQLERIESKEDEEPEEVKSDEEVAGGTKRSKSSTSSKSRKSKKKAVSRNKK